MTAAAVIELAEIDGRVDVDRKPAELSGTQVTPSTDVAEVTSAPELCPIMYIRSG